MKGVHLQEKNLKFTILNLKNLVLFYYKSTILGPKNQNQLILFQLSWI